MCQILDKEEVLEKVKGGRNAGRFYSAIGIGKCEDCPCCLDGEWCCAKSDHVAAELIPKWCPLPPVLERKK